MRILASAFACSPLWGSEPGLGWGWVYGLADQHEVTVLTHEYFRNHIEDGLTRLPPRRIHFEYLPLEPRRGAFHEQLLNSQLYYMRWQWASRARLLALLNAAQSRDEPFDLVHHVTWGNFRWPVPLHGLPVPLVLGPLGGGERAPYALYRGLPLRARMKERLRDLIIWTGRYDPWVRRSLRDARWVFCRTPQTIAALPAAARPRAVIAHDIGSPDVLSAVPSGAPTAAGRLELLFVGRLLGWKGPQFVLRALKLLRERGVDARLTMVGGGELATYLRGLASDLRIDAHVQWKQNLSREQVLALYAQHDVFVFPSLHDSGGTVVLESLSRGCPVVCVDLGGPPHFVDDSCGRVVRASDGRVDALPNRLADTLAALAADPAARGRLREGALVMARRHEWPLRVSAAYAPIVSALRSQAA